MTVSTKCILASISKYFTAHSSCFFSQLDWKSELFTSTHCWYYALCGDTQNSPQSHRQPPPVQYNSYIFVMVKLIVIFIDDMQGHFDCSCSWSWSWWGSFIMFMFMAMLMVMIVFLFVVWFIVMLMVIFMVGFIQHVHVHGNVHGHDRGHDRGLVHVLFMVLFMVMVMAIAMVMMQWSQS